MHCKSYSHFFSKKFQHICVSLDVTSNESLTNDIVSFEQLGPDRVDWLADLDLGLDVQDLTKLLAYVKLLANIVLISILKYGKYVDIFC